MLGILLFERILTSNSITTCDEDFTIESDITGIGYKCFFKCRNELKRILFNKNPQLQYIEDSAFASCENLIEIDLSTCNNLKSIRTSAFESCYKLRILKLPECLKEIGNSAFYRCSFPTINLSKLNNLKILDSDVFADNTVLYRVDLPSSLVRIESYAFFYCFNLTVLNFGENSQLQYIGFRAFYYTNLKNFVLPKSVSDIDGRFINDNINWTIHKDNPYLIDDNDFIYTSNKTILYFYKGKNKNLVVDDNVKIIKKDCFRENMNIDSIQIGNIDRIEAFAFHEVNLSITIESVGIIGDFAFEYCYSKNITIKKFSEPGIIEYHAFDKCWITNFILPEGLKIISGEAFIKSYVESIHLPDSLKVIHDRAFYNCRELHSVNISDDSELEFIGPHAFDYTNIRSLKIPRNVSNATYVGINDWTIDSDHPYLYEYNGFLIDRNNTTVFKYKGTNQTIIIPENVRLINNYCFYENNNITSIQFPTSLESIGDYAFYECSLRSINFANVILVGGYAFYNCLSLSFIDLGNVNNIEQYAFQYCSNLESIDFGNVNIIGKSAFSQCTNLAFIDFKNVSRINDFAFSGCIRLKHLIMLNVREIKYDAFYQCNKLRYVYISELEIMPSYPFNQADVFVLNDNDSLIQRLISAKIRIEKIFSFRALTQTENEVIDEKCSPDHEMQIYKHMHPYIRVR